MLAHPSLPWAAATGLHADLAYPQELSAAPKHSSCGSLVDQLIVLAAFCKELELQAHLIHFNYTGSNFLPIHELLKSQYELHQNQFDALGEFVRGAAAPMPHSNAALRSALPQFCDCTSTDGAAQLASYSANLHQQAQMARNLEAAAAETRAIDVANYAAELVAAATKTLWFLKASTASA